MNGSNILVLLDLGTAETPDYQIIGCQRDSTFEEASDSIDESCKASRSMRVDPGRFSASISLDYLFVRGRADQVALKNANRNGQKIILARSESGVITQRAIAKIDSISEVFTDQGESVVSLACTLDGFIRDVWIIGEGVIGEAFIG